MLMSFRRRSCDVFNEEENIAALHQKLTSADISRARELLGYNPSTPIEEGLSATVDWLRDEE